MSQERPDVGYTLVAVDFLPDMAVQRALVRLGGLLSEGVVNPLPQVTHRLSDVQAALRQMSQARHVGKIVTSAFDSQLPFSPSSDGSSRVLVTGGLGTLGSLTSSWLVRSGRRGVIATGRTGRLRSSVGSKSAANDMSELLRGCSAYPVTLVTADASMAEEASGLCGIGAVSGVFHASGVLADATLGNQSLSGIRSVFAPKVDAMDRLMSSLAFHPGAITVLFSSVASLTGSAGQVNYSSANAWLDSLSCAEQMRGHQSVSIQWGAWAGGGMAAEAAAVKRAVERQHMMLIDPEAGLVAMKSAVVSLGGPIASLVPFNWDSMRRAASRGQQISSMFDELVGPVDAVDAVDAVAKAHKQVAKGARMPRATRVSRASRVGKTRVQRAAPQHSVEDLKALVHGVIEDVINARIGDDEPLMAAGLDSLASVEFKNALESKVSMSLPSTLIFDFPTVADVAKLLAASMPDNAADAPMGDSTAGTAVGSGASEDYVKGEISTCVLDIIGAAVEPEEPLMAAGLDSLGAVELRNAIQRSLEIEVPSTFVFDYPTISAMASYVVRNTEIAIVDEDSVIGDAMIQSYESSEFESTIKLLSFANRLPGGAIDTSKVASGAFDASRPVPLSRWDLAHEELALGEAPIRFSHFLDDVGMFDPALFALSSNEAAIVDPQHRNLLECALEAVHGSPERPADFKNSGVFVGIASTEYRQVVHDNISGYSPLSATGTLSISVAAGRISYTFGFNGPAVPVETACSSSLVALHTAVNSMKLGQCENAFSGGVNMLLIPSTTAMFQKAGMLAADGRCKTLSSTADGYVRADSCGMLLLTSDDEVSQYSLIVQGSAVNQDGRSSSLTAPNGPAQQAVIRSALFVQRNSPDELSVIQMHGTGTPLGDPIEVGAISEVVAACRQTLPVALTASKSWVGHSEAGAGVVGLTHATFMKEQALSLPILHLGEMNKYLSNSDACWSAYRQVAPRIENGDAHLIGTSAFAFQGTNAHSIVASDAPLDAVTAGGCAVSWNRSVCWIAAPVHSTIIRGFVGGASRSLHMEAKFLDGRRGSFIMDHQVMGKILVPGAAFMELAGAVGNICLRDGDAVVLVQNATIPAPLEVTSNRASVESSLQVTVSRENGSISLSSGALTHLKGFLRPCVDLNLGAGAASDASIATGVSEAGVPRRGRALVIRGTSTACTFGNIDVNRELAAEDVNASPAQIDCCFQLGAVPPVGGTRLMRVPTAVGAFRSQRMGKSTLYGTSLEASRTSTETILDYHISPPGIGKVVSVHQMIAKSLLPVAATSAKATATVSREQPSYTIEWVVDAADMRADSLLGEVRPPGDLVEFTLSETMPAQQVCAASISLMQNRRGRKLRMASGRGLHGNDMPCGARASSQGLLWGLVRTANLERPGSVSDALDVHSRRKARLILDGGRAAGGDASSIYGSITDGNVVKVAKLGPAYVATPAPSISRSSPKGSCIISGGTGSIGSMVACMVRETEAANDLHLMSRSGKVGATNTLTSVLQGEDICCLHMADLASTEDASRAASRVAGSACLHVLHAGGALYDGLMDSQTAGMISKGFAPKIAALENLRRAVYGHGVLSESLFSSVASLLGSAGQANYSAANSLLDSMASVAHTMGINSVSMQWGAWLGAGMAAQDKSTAARVERLGMKMVQPEDGLKIIRSVLSDAMVPSLIVAVPFIWDRMALRLKPEVPTIFEDFAIGALGSTAMSSAAFGGDSHASGGGKKVLVSASLRKKHRPKGKGARAVGSAAAALDPSVYVAQVLSCAQSILGKDIGDSDPLMSAGMDSLTSVEFKNALESQVGMALPSTLVFDYPTAEAIGKFVHDSLAPAESLVAVETTEPGASPPDPSMYVAQVLSCAQSILGKDIGDSDPLMSAGMDSLTSVEFKNALESQVGMALPSTLVFDYPTAEAIGRYIAESSGSSGDGTAPAVDDHSLILAEITSTMSAHPGFVVHGAGCRHARRCGREDG